MSLSEDIDNIMSKDPAARSRFEVLLCYPGLHAVTLHRLANWFWRRKAVTCARVIGYLSRMVTGIEIHPGATLGRRVFIDHGMGVVVGETAIVGDDVVIYQGVTLGAGAAARGGAATRGSKRHPTLANGVVVGSGAEIQGDIHVGENAQVASGSIVLKDVPPNSIVVGVPGRVIIRDGKRVNEPVPDIEAEAIKSLKDRIKTLEGRIDQLSGGKSSGLSESASQAISGAGAAVYAPANGSETGLGGENQVGEDPVDVFLHGAGI